jgi:hypothetical protein
VLTLSLSENTHEGAGSEATRLDMQSRVLQPLIAELGADEAHWHLLPGRVDRAGERRLARRAIDLMRRPVWSTGSADDRAAHQTARDRLLFTLAGKSSHKDRAPGPAKAAAPPWARQRAGMTPANDLPALPRLRHDKLGSVLDALADRALPIPGYRLTFQIGTSCAVIMSRQARA